MNCSNCGAPLAVVEGREYLQCPCCRSLHFPEPLEISADRIVPLGQPATIECPQGHGRLILGTLDGRRVLFCEACRGILVPSDDFAWLVQLRRGAHRGPDDKPHPLEPEQLEQEVHCPACEAAMEVHPYYGPGNVVIDSCRRCRLVWLDCGELARIERAPGRR